MWLADPSGWLHDRAGYWLHLAALLTAVLSSLNSYRIEPIVRLGVGATLLVFDKQAVSGIALFSTRVRHHVQKGTLGDNMSACAWHENSRY